MWHSPVFTCIRANRIPVKGIKNIYQELRNVGGFTISLFIPPIAFNNFLCTRYRYNNTCRRREIHLSCLRKFIIRRKMTACKKPDKISRICFPKFVEYQNSPWIFLDEGITWMFGTTTYASVKIRMSLRVRKNSVPFNSNFTQTSQIIYPAHSTKASVIVCQCLLVLRVPPRVLPAHILIHSTQPGAKLCVLLHTSLLRVYQCRTLFRKATPTIHKNVLLLHATPTWVTAKSWHLHGINISPPAHTARATNSSPSTITQRISKKTSDPNT